MKKVINSELILASKNELTGDILYTWKLTYPYIIHGEVMTHRMFSRNAASSRAVPMKKMRQNILRDPFVPYSLGRNQKGMQAGAEQSGWRRSLAVAAWKTLRYPAVFGNWTFEKLGVHKQIGNRFLMPWLWMETLVTTTEVSNFFKLRAHVDAEPHFQVLARQMKRQVAVVGEIFENWNGANGDVRDRSKEHHHLAKRCQRLSVGEWHMPFIDSADRYGYSSCLRVPTPVEELKKISTARCARVSYYLPENGQRSDSARDLELHDRLRSSGHWSPFEHVAAAISTPIFVGNLRGFVQYRKEFSEESGDNR